MNTKKIFFKNFSVIVITIIIVLLNFLGIYFSHHPPMMITSNSIYTLYSELVYFFILLVIQLGILSIIYVYFCNNSKPIEFTKKNKTKYNLIKLIIITIIIVFFILFGITNLNTFSTPFAINYIENITIFSSNLFIGIYLLAGICTLFIINLKTNFIITEI